MVSDSQTKQPSLVELKVAKLAKDYAEAKNYSTYGIYIRSRDLPKFISSKKSVTRFLNWETEARENYERAIYNTCCNIRDLGEICRGLRAKRKSWAYDYIRHQYARRALEGERLILAQLLDMRFERVA